MSKANKTSQINNGKAITKTISLPADLEAEATKKRIDGKPEMSWSRFVRELIRADLEAVKSA